MGDCYSHRPISIPVLLVFSIDLLRHEVLQNPQHRALIFTVNNRIFYATFL